MFSSTSALFLGFVLSGCAADRRSRDVGSLAPKQNMSQWRLVRDAAKHTLWCSHVHRSYVLECSVLCATDSRCLVFTLTVGKSFGPSTKLCCGYSKDISSRLLLLMRGQGGQGLSVYRVSERSKVGVVHFSSQKPLPRFGDNTRSNKSRRVFCEHKKCVCTPGYVYSFSSRTCVARQLTTKAVDHFFAEGDDSTNENIDAD